MSDGKIKVCFLHPYIKSIDDIVNLLCIKDLPITENFELDYEDPDYVIATDYVISSLEYLKQFRKLVYEKPQNSKKPVRIFWTEECVSPDFNIYDYTITWNYKLSYRDRAARIPPHIFIGSNLTEQVNTLSYNKALNLLRNRNLRFCNFMYSNGRRKKKLKRDELFYALSGYKRVDSIGRYLNNIGSVVADDNKTSEVFQGLGRGGKYSWQETSIRLKQNYKFTIAAENAQSDGYTSEKLFTSFCAHSVPIYWGNPYVAEEYNPEAFVNCNDYDSFDGVVKRVKEIDENDELWARMASSPWQTEKQAQRSENEYEHYKKFIENIFASPIEKAYRRAKGHWEQSYEKWYFQQIFVRSQLGRFRSLLSPQKILNPEWYYYKFFVKKLSLDEFLKENNFS